MDKPFQMLSLSGGGIRGLYTINVLAELEQFIVDQQSFNARESETYSIGQHFDLICGTSIGGLIAIALANGLTARYIRQMMDENRLTIFPKKRMFSDYKKLVQPSYSAEPLKELLKKMFGNATIGDLRTRILVPAISYSNGQVKAFKTPHHNDFVRDHKYKLVDVALATSAAPTYFPIHVIEGERYVDGGLAVNSPVLMGVFEALNWLNQDIKNIHVMQVGTMGSKQTSDHGESIEGGYLKTWGKGQKIIEIAMSATEGLHNFLAMKMLKETDNLLNIDDEPDQNRGGILALDNASDQAAEILKSAAMKRADYCWNTPLFRKIITQIASSPNFNHGSQKK